MIFVAAGSCRTRLERLTQLLISAFPGSTIYRHTDSVRMLHDVLSNKVDAVFLVEEAGKTVDLKFMRALAREKPDVPVCIVSDQAGIHEDADEEQAEACFVRRISEEQLRSVVRL